MFVLNFTELRLRLFLILGKSEARVLKKVVLNKKKSVIAATTASMTVDANFSEDTVKTNGKEKLRDRWRKLRLQLYNCCNDCINDSAFLLSVIFID